MVLSAFPQARSDPFPNARKGARLGRAVLSWGGQEDGSSPMAKEGQGKGDGALTSQRRRAAQGRLCAGDASRLPRARRFAGAYEPPNGTQRDKTGAGVILLCAGNPSGS